MADQRPYVRYSSNGTNRIDFIVTQGHPAEINGDFGAGRVRARQRVHDTKGTVLGPLDGSVRFSQLTPVFNGTPSQAGGTADIDAWTTDIEEDGAGRPVVAFSVRLPTPPAAPGTGHFDHRYYIGRWTGSRWQVHQVAFAGGELYPGRTTTPGRLRSTRSIRTTCSSRPTSNPRTGGSVVSSADGHPHWEIYEGRSTDSGATWTWQAVTANSTSDNIRPVAVAGPRGDFALLWLRGRYPSYIRYNLARRGDRASDSHQTPEGDAHRVGGTADRHAGRFGGATTTTCSCPVSGRMATASCSWRLRPAGASIAKPLRSRTP